MLTRLLLDQYTPSHLIMISHNRLAQYWEEMGHISYYQRIDLDALMHYEAPEPPRNSSFVPLPFGGWALAPMSHGEPENDDDED